MPLFIILLISLFLIPVTKSYALSDIYGKIELRKLITIENEHTSLQKNIISEGILGIQRQNKRTAIRLELKGIMYSYNTYTNAGDIATEEKSAKYEIFFNKYSLEIRDFPIYGTIIKCGKDIIDWKTLYFYSPTDIINPYNYINFLDTAEKIPTELINIGYIYKKLMIEYVYEPYHRADKIPFTNNYQQLPILTYQKTDALKAGRIMFSTDIMDLYIIYGRRISPFPTISLTGISFHKEEVYGASISIDIKGIQISSEIANYKDLDTKKSINKYGISIEYIFENGTSIDCFYSYGMEYETKESELSSYFGIYISKDILYFGSIKIGGIINLPYNKITYDKYNIITSITFSYLVDDAIDIGFSFFYIDRKGEDFGIGSFFGDYGKSSLLITLKYEF
jgi:hypothetical protein